MSLDRTPELCNDGDKSPTISTTDDACNRTISLLGLHRLQFDLARDIHCEALQDFFKDGNFFIRNFEENGYASIIKYISCNSRKAEMGTGYAIVSEQYLQQRGKIQGINFTQQAFPIGRTSYINESGQQITTGIYFVGPASKKQDGSPTAITYTQEDIVYALREILGINSKEDKRDIILG